MADSELKQRAGEYFRRAYEHQQRGEYEEAIELYFSKLAPDGVLCVHTSNRHMDLVKPVSDIAVALGKKAIVGHDVGRGRRDQPPFLGHFGSEYVMLANDEKDLPKEGEKNLGPENVQRWDIPIPPVLPAQTNGLPMSWPGRAQTL